VLRKDREMKKYKVKVVSTVTKYHLLSANSEAEAKATAGDIFSPMEFGEEVSDSFWDQDVVEVGEVQRALTAEENAFLEAYLNCVAIAEREDVVRFLLADSEERSSNAFYDSMSDVYTSICDAKEVWYAAMQFAKEGTK
jgi:hypothetical protein